MRTLEKTIRAAHVESRPWKQTLYTFLRNYRATPHCSTGMPPADVLFGRPLRIKLPGSPLSLHSHTDTKLRQEDAVAKNRMKLHADKARHATPSTLKVGDMVLCRQRKEGKLCPAYNPRSYKVIAIKGSMVTAKNDNHVITRNSSHFKPLTVAKDHYSKTVGVENDVMDWCGMPNPEPLAPEPVAPNSPQPESPIRRYPVRVNRGPPTYLSDFD